MTGQALIDANGRLFRIVGPEDSALTTAIEESCLSSRNLASPISRSRSFGFRSKHRSSIFRNRAGTRSRSIGCSSTQLSACIVSSPLNSRSPVSISHATTPNAQISARLSTFFPRACSGAM